MRYTARIMSCVALCLVLAGCGGGDGSPGAIAGPGTIRQFFAEGGGFTIMDDKGKSYLPDNLSSQFQQSGLRVYFEGHLTGQSSTQQVGDIIHLDNIHALPSGARD